MSMTPTPDRPFDRDAAQLRVRHPLRVLHKYIRAYVVLEGLAVALLFLAVWFWVGLALDYGSFRLFAFDWVQELRDISPDSNNALYARLVLLAVLVLALLGVALSWIVLRWLREFSDPALALVLERRFPRELGDRLITAVELSDPAMARQYGYSSALVDKTIQDVEQRLERLPVAEAFNWGRLMRLWVLVGVATLGLLLLVGLTSVAASAATGDSASPVNFAWRFTDAASIWGERNLLLMDSYWPRRAHLELIRFQHAQDNPDEMRVGRDEQRPDVQVRAVQWVVADRAAPDGWRALRWADLDRFVEPELLARADIPADFSHWVIDLDDLDPRVPAGVLPPNLHLKTAGAVRQAVQEPVLRENVAKADAQDAVAELLDWRRWTVDKIALQEQKQEVRIPLRATAGYEPLMQVFARLEELAASPRMSRTLRKLAVPDYVQVNYRGKSTKATEPGTPLPDQKFAIGLNQLKETVRFRVRGEDYYTPPKTITLVPPPAITKLSIDKEEPAYLHHRLQGGEQEPLKGQKQVYKDYAVSITGEQSTIEVPLGTDLVLKAETDRKLKEPVRIKAPAKLDAGAVVPQVGVKLADDGTGFSVAFEGVARPMEFVFEYNDEDNVKGRRRVAIRPVDDRPPRIDKVDLTAALRKPRFKGEGSKAQSAAAGAFLITPDALLPFEGRVSDDHGLTRVGWVYDAEPIDLELVGASGKGQDRLPTLLQGGGGLPRRARYAVGAMRYGFLVSALRPDPALFVGPQSLGWLARALQDDPSAGAGQREGFAMMEEFRRLLERRSIEEIPATALPAKLQEPPPRRERWEHLLKDETGFDVKRRLPRLKSANPREEGQLHYLLTLSVQATDNNVETGRPYQDDEGRPRWGNTSRNEKPFVFLVVSENELLAQIALEEEALYERLDKVVEKLRSGQTLAEEQVAKLNGGLRDDDLGLVALRLDEVRKLVLDGASATREIHTAYAKILKELEVNRVSPAKREKVASKIVEPLEQVVDAKAGNFVLTDDFLLRAYQPVEEDVNANRGLKNGEQHVQNIRAARDQLNTLIDRLNSVLIAMNEGILESRLVESLIIMERTQRQNSESLRLLRRQQEEDLLKVLQGLK